MFFVQHAWSQSAQNASRLIIILVHGGIEGTIIGHRPKYHPRALKREGAKKYFTNAQKLVCTLHSHNITSRKSRPIQKTQKSLNMQRREKACDE